MGNCLIRKHTVPAKMDILYTYPGTVPGATTLGVYDYKFIVVLNIVGSETGTPGNCVVLAKGGSDLGGCAWGTNSGYRTYTYASNGTFSFDAGSNVTPWLIMGFK